VAYERKKKGKKAGKTYEECAHEIKVQDVKKTLSEWDEYYTKAGKVSSGVKPITKKK
jgi:hypothetical protein